MFEYNKDKHYPKETESRVVIRFQDCDPLQHLNNAKYFDYFLMLGKIRCRNYMGWK